MMDNIRSAFERSGMTLNELGEGLGYDGPTARKRAWILLHRTSDPRVSTVLAVAGLSKSVTITMLRHSAATHLLDLGVDVRNVQKVLGHDRLATTMRYMLLSYNQQPHVHPLDLLPPAE